jgi:hypothetical protein
MQWERKVGTYVTQQSTHLVNSSDRPKRRGGEMSSGKSEGRVCMPLRCLYHSQLFVPIGQTKVRWARKRKPERGYALCLDSHISVNPCDKFFQSAPRKWKEKRWVVKEPQRRVVCHSDIYFIQFLWLSVLIGQTEGRRRWAVKEKPRGVRTSLRIHTSVNSCHQFFQSARWMSGEKDAPKRMCMQLRYRYLSQFFSYWLRRESEMSNGKEARRIRTSLKYPYPSQPLRSIPLIGPTDRRGTQISLWLR